MACLLAPTLVAGRAALPVIGDMQIDPDCLTLNDDVTSCNETKIESQTGLPCELEMDCPVRQYCYLDDEGEGYCDCYQFYGFDGPECLETNILASALVIVCVVYAVYQTGLWFQTFAQLNNSKVKAFSASSASGHVTISCLVAGVFEVMMNFCYLIVAAGLNPSYEVADLVRPICFGKCTINIVDAFPSLRAY
jgi:hypothetical protein